MNALSWCERSFRSLKTATTPGSTNTQQMGCFNCIDPLINGFADWMPYNFAFNDPVGMNARCRKRPRLLPVSKVINMQIPEVNFYPGFDFTADFTYVGKDARLLQDKLCKRAMFSSGSVDGFRTSLMYRS